MLDPIQVRARLPEAARPAFDFARALFTSEPRPPIPAWPWTPEVYLGFFVGWLAGAAPSVLPNPPDAQEREAGGPA